MDTVQTKITKGSSGYKLAIIFLFLGSVVAFGAEYCVQPIIPVFAREFGLSPAKSSLAVSFGTGGMAASMLIIAKVAARLHRKLVMALAITVAALLMGLMSFSDSFTVILGLRLVQGILLAGYPALAIAYIYEEFDIKIVGTVLGYYISGTALGGLAGRLFLSAATDFFGWRVALGGLGIVYLCIGVLFWFGLPAPRKALVAPREAAAGGGFMELLCNKYLIGVYLIGFLIMGTFVCTYNFISYVLLAPPYNLSQTVVGFVFFMYLVGSMASAIMGRMTDKYGNGFVVCLSCSIMLVGTMLTAFMPLVCKIAGVGIFTYGFFGAHVAACGWSSKIVNADKARISSLYMVFYYLGASVMGTAGGYFLPLYGWFGVVCFSLALELTALFIAFKMISHIAFVRKFYRPLRMWHDMSIHFQYGVKR